MPKLEVTEKQLRVIQNALELYSRIGIGQFDKIKDHPTFERHLSEVCTPKKEPEVGDRTPQGEILEIKDGKALINGSVKDGMWCKDQEWKPLDKVKLSTDYGKYHEIRDAVDEILIQPRNMLCNDPTLPRHGSWGIHNPNVDNSCRIAFDIIQVIRHEYWKKDEERTDWTRDARINFTSDDADSNKIKCEL
jgi:hypothetical protein